MGTYGRFIAAFVLIWLAGCGEEPPRLDKLDDDSVIVAFGDSLTYGTGAKEHQSYPAVLEELIGITVINEGVSGEQSRAGRKRLPKVVEAEQPDLVIFIHGGNDFLRKRPRSETETNLRAMIDYLHKHDIDVIMLGVPDAGILLSTADVYETVAEDMNVPMDDDIIPDLLSNNQYKSDYVHPNAKGYRKMAQALRDLLKESGAL